jgi:hypothetical protein
MLVKNGYAHFLTLEDELDNLDPVEFEEAKIDFINSPNFNQISDERVIQGIFDYDEMENGGDDETQAALVASHPFCPIDLLEKFANIPWGSSSYDPNILYVGLVHCGTLASLQAIANPKLPRESFQKVLKTELKRVENEGFKTNSEIPIIDTLLWHLLNSPNCSNTDKLEISEALHAICDFAKYESSINELLS